MSAWEILAPAFAVCVLLIATHTYFGLHVLARGIIFVDIALAQVALLGTSVAFAYGYDAHSATAHAYAFVAALLAAVAFAGLRRVRDKTTREVAIGSVYVVATAGSIVLLANAPTGMDELKAMFNGNILWTRWPEVARLALLYAALAVLHWWFRRPFHALSFSHSPPKYQLAWEVLFFVSFATTISFALDLAGVLLVFAYLIIPAFSASLLAARFWPRFAVAFVLAAAGSALGLGWSYVADLPTGAAMVVALGLLPLAAALVHVVRRRARTD